MINAQNNQGRTALHLAALGDHAECVQLLLNAGAHADIRDNEGRTALECAIQASSKKAINALSPPLLVQPGTPSRCQPPQSTKLPLLSMK